MSFVEGVGTVGVDVADPAFAVCLSGLLLLIALLAAVPALASVLRLLHADSTLGRLVRHFFPDDRRGNRK
jgi:hypothetical protein